MTRIELEQTRETRLTQIVRGPFICKYASYRKSEDAKRSLRNEDYLVVQLGTQSACFAVCDGVGSSFHGNVGSQILGELLIQWLDARSLQKTSGVEDYPRLRDGLQAELQRELNRASELATSVVNSRPLKGKEGLVRLAEEEQRKTYGSQSNFAAGLIWPRTSEQPNGLVVLFWLGNARIKLFNHENDVSASLGWGLNPDQEYEVWSSKDGIIGDVYAYCSDLSTVTHVIAYTDGFEKVEENVRPELGVGEIETLVTRAQTIKDDDATLIEIAVSDYARGSFADDVSESLQQMYRGAPAPIPLIKPIDPRPDEPKKIGPSGKKEWSTNRAILTILALILGTLLTLMGFVFGYASANLQISSRTDFPTVLPTVSIQPSPFLSPTPIIVTPLPVTAAPLPFGAAATETPAGAPSATDGALPTAGSQIAP